MESLPVNPKQAAILIYSKDHCPYCDAAKNLFTQKGVGYTEIDLSQRPEEAPKMLEKSAGAKTVPQIFIGDAHIGGFDDTQALDTSGELEKLLFPNGR